MKLAVLAMFEDDIITLINMNSAMYNMIHVTQRDQL